MNHSLLSADRTTHIKIVSVALIAATLVAAGAISAHLTTGADRSAIGGPVVKAGRNTLFTSGGPLTIR